jgi:ribulose kinase
VGGQPGKNGLILTAGQPVGQGLTEKAAKDFGLLPGTPVGSAVIDAYAGWVGTIAAKSDTDRSTGRLKLEESSHRLAACAGTSTCHIVQVGPRGSARLSSF